MSVNNLHSLISSRWFIHGPYGRSLLPSLFAILNGKEIAIKPGGEQPPQAMVAGRTGPMVAAATAGTGNGQPAEYVLVISMKDPIYKYDQECGPRGTKSKMRTMEAYRNDPACKGVVLDWDSGGGQVSGTPEMYDYVLNYPKPVVSYTDGMMCSAAYYIGAAAKTIIANKRADYIGSIGMMIHFINMDGVWEQKGAKIVTHYATKSTEKNKDWEALLKGDAEGYIKNEMDPGVEIFHADMKAVRPNLKDEVLAGGTWDAAGALERGLVDKIGTLQDAVDEVFAQASAEESNNQNNNNMSKERANLQAALGLNAPLVETADKGSYLNGEQLDAAEAHIAAQAADVARLTGEVATATQAAQAAADALTAAQTAHADANKATGDQVDAMVTAAGITATGTTDEKLTALAGHFAAINAKDGGKFSNPKVDADNQEEEGPAMEVGGFDISAAMRC